MIAFISAHLALALMCLWRCLINDSISLSGWILITLHRGADVWGRITVSKIESTHSLCLCYDLVFGSQRWTFWDTQLLLYLTLYYNSFRSEQFVFYFGGVWRKLKCERKKCQLEMNLAYNCFDAVGKHSTQEKPRERKRKHRKKVPHGRFVEILTLYASYSWSLYCVKVC